jgi:hypothetical protein
VELITAIGDGPVALDSSIFIYFIEQHFPICHCSGHSSSGSMTETFAQSPQS